MRPPRPWSHQEQLSEQRSLVGRLNRRIEEQRALLANLNRKVVDQGNRFATLLRNMQRQRR
jgi:hypothetical protein